MAFPSRVSAHQQLENLFGLRTIACVLVPLLFSILAMAGAKPAKDSPTPAVETQTKEPAAKTTKRPEKYDIDHIGQRGIGHGFNLYSEKREQALGQSLAASFDRMTKPMTDPVVTEFVNRIAQRLVRYSDAEVPFTVRVIDSGEIPRAYGFPGGFLYVDSALILSAETEAELASVMAHEIAHVAARHATRALSRKRVCDVVGSLAMLAGPAGMGAADFGGLAGPLSVKKFSRDAEYEADLLGIEYAYAAGYDPQALLDALEKLHAIEVQRNEELAKIPGYHLASHVPFHKGIAKGFANYPLTEERIDRLQAEISTFLPDRKDYILDTNEFQEIKAHLLASQTPVLRHHGANEKDGEGPVLRRTQDDNVDAPTMNAPATNLRSFAFVTQR